MFDKQVPAMKKKTFSLFWNWRNLPWKP